MKTQLLIMIVLFKIQATAQATLTSVIMPQVGAKVTYMVHDTAGVYPGPAGPAVFCWRSYYTFGNCNVYYQVKKM